MFFFFDKDGKQSCDFHFVLAPRASKKHIKKVDDTVVIFACLDFQEFLLLGFFAKSRIWELSISMIGSTIIIISGIPKFTNCPSLQNSRKLKPLKYYQIYSN